MKILEEPRNSFPYSCEHCDALLSISMNDLIVKDYTETSFSCESTCLYCKNTILVDGVRIPYKIAKSLMDKYKTEHL